MDKSAKQYFRSLKKQINLPVKGKKEFLLMMEELLNKALEENTDPSYEFLCEKLGTPEEKVAEFLGETDPAVIKKAIGKKRIVIIAVIVILISFVSGMVYLVIDGHTNMHGYSIETLEDVPDNISENESIISVEGY